jgi:multicomponent Na+:H+ antiporter subunit F
MNALGLSGLDPSLTVATIVVALLIGAGLLRVYAGPTVFDRLVAVSLVSVNGVVIIVLVGFLLGRPALFLDIALGFALLVFLLPLALGRFFDAGGQR